MKNLTPTNRRGAALIAALIAMSILAVIMTVVTLQIVAQRQVVRQRQRQLQAEWLARAGVEIAAARLLENPAVFVEEKRELLPDTNIRIAVEKLAEGVYVITVEAVLSAKEGTAVKRTTSARFSRTDADGAVRLTAMPLETPKR